MKHHLLAIAVCISLSSFAQTEERLLGCGQQQATEKLFSGDPAALAVAEAKDQELLAQSRDHDRSASPPVYVIPVVFHIIHDYGVENISDAQVLDCISILNRDYRKLNADTSQIVAPFDTLAADCQIEFHLAQLDPNGNCTNGIERIASMETYIGDDGSKLNQWPRDKYLNIWVVKQTFSGIAGYSYFPSVVDPASMASLDGIVMLHDYVGSIGTGSPPIARFMVHEVGHWLGLKHLGGGNVCLDGDGISDTPVTMGWGMCQLTNNDICNPGIDENVQNFMESSYCMRMFTYGQRNFMQAVLNSSISQRNNLWTNANLALTGALNTPVTCLPHADFKSNRKMICDGSSVVFTDQSWGSSATSWQWSLTGPSTFTSTVQNPTFPNVTGTGWYDVTLIAGNATGSDTITKTHYLLVSSDTATLNPLYSESFLTSGIVSSMYVVNDRYGNGSAFAQSYTVGHSDSACVMLEEFGNCLQGDIDELITPSYFLSYNTSLQLSFYYAYTAVDSVTSSNQKLKLWSSADCGQTWQARWTNAGVTLPTVPYDSLAFYPESHLDWDTVVVNLPASVAQPNVRFKFEFTSPDDGAANNLFIDNINILSTNVGIAESENAGSFLVYPNPGDGHGTLSYSLTESSEVQYRIYDVSGRLISVTDVGQQSAGSYSEALNTNLSPGTYFIEMKIGDAVSVKKYVVTAR